jgi:lipopolysaccharide biosynthesis protein
VGKTIIWRIKNWTYWKLIWCRNYLIAALRFLSNYAHWLNRYTKNQVRCIFQEHRFSFLSGYFHVSSQNQIESLPLRIKYLKEVGLKRKPKVDYIAKLSVEDLPPFESKVSVTPSVVIILHIYYLDIGHEIINTLQDLPFEISQIVVTHSFSGNETLQILDEAPKDLREKFTFFFSQNIHRDSAPFINVLKEIPLQGNCFLKLHTKKSPHLKNGVGEGWRRNLINSLLHFDGSTNLLYELDSSQNPIWACPSDWIGTESQWGANNFEVWKLTSELEIPFLPKIEFPVGNMYWFNRVLLDSMSHVEVPKKISKTQMKWTDATWAHAIERLPGQICLTSGKIIIIK